MVTDRPVDELTVKEAGRLGGITTLARHGVVHHREAGRKGRLGWRPSVPQTSAAIGARLAADRKG